MQGTRCEGLGSADAVAAVDHDCEVRERGGDCHADAHEQDGACGCLSVGREVKGREREDAEHVHCRDDLGDDAVALDHARAERDGGGGEEQHEDDGECALECAVEPEACGEHDCAKRETDGEGCVEDLVDGAPRAADCDHGEV